MVLEQIKTEWNGAERSEKAQTRIAVKEDILLPDGKPVFISVFVFRSKEPKALAEKMIASVARTAWRHFTRTAGNGQKE